jgi:O-acetyl-ADP-ribose deacetylase
MGLTRMDLPRDKDYVVMLKIGDPGEIRLMRGDITKYRSDAIVNAANSELLPGGGVCGAIHRAGGPGIAEECRRIRSERGRVPPGKAVATTAGQLPAKYVIHAVGPVWQGGNHGEAEILAGAYRESMRIAEELKLHSIAFPAISAGIFGYPVEQAAGIAISTLMESLRSAKHLVSVSVLLFDKATLDVFAKTAMAQRQPASDKSCEVGIGIIDA